jgi:hypothetical protein
MHNSQNWEENDQNSQRKCQGLNKWKDAQFTWTLQWNALICFLHKTVEERDRFLVRMQWHRPYEIIQQTCICAHPLTWKYTLKKHLQLLKRTSQGQSWQQGNCKKLEIT